MCIHTSGNKPTIDLRKGFDWLKRYERCWWTPIGVIGKGPEGSFRWSLAVEDLTIGSAVLLSGSVSLFTNIALFEPHDHEESVELEPWHRWRASLPPFERAHYFRQPLGVEISDSETGELYGPWSCQHEKFAECFSEIEMMCEYGLP